MRTPNPRGPTLPAVALLVGGALPLPRRTGGPPGGDGLFAGDKLLHGVAHAWLAATLAEALCDTGRSLPTAAVAAVALSTGYGLGIELLQRSVPGRRFEAGDVVASGAGSALGAARWARRRGKRVSPDGPPPTARKLIHTDRH